MQPAQNRFAALQKRPSQKTERDGQFREFLARKINDTDLANWVELDELRKRDVE